MPNWTDDEGYNWFGKLECKRCLVRFDHDKNGEIPAHDCIGGRYCSVSIGAEHHLPKKLSSLARYKKLF